MERGEQPLRGTSRDRRTFSILTSPHPQISLWLLAPLSHFRTPQTAINAVRASTKFRTFAALAADQRGSPASLSTEDEERQTQAQGGNETESDEGEGEGEGEGTPRAHAPPKLPLVDLSSSSEDDEYEEAESDVEGEGDRGGLNTGSTAQGAPGAHSASGHDGNPDQSVSQRSRGSVHAIAECDSTLSPEERAEDKESAVATAREMQGVQSYADGDDGKGEGGGGDGEHAGGGDFKSRMHDLSDKVQKVL